MNRRQFLHTSAAASLLTATAGSAEKTPGFASPAEAMKAPRETLLFLTCIATDPKKPDCLAVVDADPASKNYGRVMHRLEMPNPGDELHHFGWNICSSCHGKPGDRRYLVVPGLKSGRVHVIDAADPLALKVHKVIEPEAIANKADLSAPHTVHCLADGTVMLSMLGDAKGNGPGGFLLLGDDFEPLGKWEKDATGMKYNYDFWYQPRANVMVSSEWGAPKTFWAGFKPDDVKAGRYGKQLHVWDWKTRKIRQSIDLGDGGLIPLEVRFAHDPAKSHGFVGAALSSTVFHFHPDGERWAADKVIEVPPVEVKGVPFPVPGLITDLILSMDDRFLYFSNWLQGDIRQYDVTDPAKPKLVGQLQLGGITGKARELGGNKLGGGPQMLQLSLDGKRLYVTNSLLSVWDDQFYPDLAKAGSWLLQVACDTTKGGLTLNEKFVVDFGKEPNGPARAHEVRYPGGDCTSDIFA